jgi:type IV pilus assembly protein PilV
MSRGVGPAMPASAVFAQRGLSLVEVLVTIVLVSVGLLGIAGLQIASVQNTSSAAQRFEATLLAEDILERMRANRAEAITNAYDLAFGAAPATVGVAQDDLSAWRLALTTLPGGDGAVDVNQEVVAGVTSNIATITVRWTDVSDDNSPADDDEPEDVTSMTFQLRTEL